MTGGGVRWHRLGRWSWFTGRLWSWRPVDPDNEYRRPVYVRFIGRDYAGELRTVKIGAFGLALFWDRHPYSARP